MRQRATAAELRYSPDPSAIRVHPTLKRPLSLQTFNLTARKIELLLITLTVSFRLSNKKFSHH